MSLTVGEAQLQLNTPKTISELFEIVANVSSDLNEYGGNKIQAGDTFILFSGNLADGTHTSNIEAEIASQRLSDQRVWGIGDTHVGEFLNSGEFQKALQNAIAQENYGQNFSLLSSLEQQHVLNEFKLIYAGTGVNAEGILTRVSSSSLWDVASYNVAKTAADAEVNFKIVAPMPMSSNSVLAQSELLAILATTGTDTTIDGISVNDYKTLLATHGYEAVKQIVTINSATQIIYSDLSKENLTKYLKADPLDFTNIANDLEKIKIDDPEKLKKITDYISNLTPEQLDYLKTGQSVFEEVGNTHNGYGILKKLSAIGVLFSFALAASASAQASNEGNDEQAKEIMKLWAIDMTGSVAGEILGGVVAGLGVAALATVGVVSAPISGALILGATLIGGIYGADAAKDLYELTKDKDGNDKRDIYDRISNIMYGATEFKITDPFVATLSGAKSYEMQADLSQEEILENAKEDIAWRYAIYALNPFVISNIDYTRHNLDGKLDLYDPETGKGMTEQYLKDRTSMLELFVKYYTAQLDDNDIEYDDNGTPELEDDIYFETDNKPYNQDWDSNTIKGNWDFIALDRHLEGDQQFKLTIDGVGLSLSNHKVIFGSTSDDIIEGDSENDFLYGGAGADEISGGKGDDYIEGGSGADKLNGGDDHDILIGLDGNDILRGGDGGDSLSGGADQDQLFGDEGNDYLNGGKDNDYLYGGKGNDILVGEDGWLTAEGGEDNDIIYANSSPTASSIWVDNLKGDSGNDIIYGYDGENKIDGGIGNDVLHGGKNHDDIEGGAGNDIIYGYDGENTSGSVIANDLKGGAGNDIIYGGVGVDFIEGGSGANILEGKSGNDAYLITDETLGTHYIKDKDGFIQANLGKLTVGEYDKNLKAWKSSNGLYIIRKLGEDTDNTIISIHKIGDEKNTIYIDGWKNNGDMGLTFSNPIPVTSDAVNYTIKDGNSGNNLIVNRDGYASSWSVNADGGNDYINTTMYTDYVEAGSGNDLIETADGDDTIYGGDGHDSISAGLGKDNVYAGAGNDVIFSAAFTVRWDKIESIWYTAQYGEDWKIAPDLKIFDNPTLHFNGFDYEFENASANLFAQGKYLQGSDIFYPDIKKYIIYDNKRYEAGSLEYYLLNHDEQKTSSAGISGADTIYGGTGDDYIIGSGDNDEINGDEDHDYILGMQGDDELYGGQGKDHIFGGTGRDYVTGGIGNDFLVGEYEADVIYGGADNDIIYGDLLIVPEKGIVPTNPDTSRYGDDVIYGGLGVDQIWGGGGNDFIYGGADNDELRGEDGNDFIYGDDDEDHLWGGQGDDYLFGGAQKDVLNGGAGHDFLYAEAGDDIVKGGADNDIIYGGGDSDILHGDAGNDIIYGGNDVDHIYGGTDDDIIFSGEGHDHLEGGSGSDLYVFSLGDGHDTIIETVSDLASLNHQNFIYFNFDSSQARDVVRNGFDLIIKYGVDDQVTVKNYYMVRNTSKNSYLEGQELFEQIEISEVRFENGEIWDTETIMELAPPPEVNELPPASLEGVAYFIDALVTRNEVVSQEKNVLTYSFPTHSASGQQAFNSEQILAVEQALDKFSYVLNLSFVRSETGQSDIQFYFDDLIEVGAGAAAGYADAQTGQVHLNALIFNTASSLDEGTQGFETLLHEIGHLLGLEHPFEAPVLPMAENHQDNTIMSYTSNGVYDTELKIYDIAALHYFYGVNSNVRAENNTYTFADRYIWDGAGLDTFDASIQTAKVHINLNAGSWNYIAEQSLSILEQGQSFIGYGTTIENAKGGIGDDTLIGSVQNNILEGGLGQDIYIFNENFGQDEIIEVDSINKIKFDFDLDETKFYYSEGVIYYKNDSIKIDVDKFELFEINDVVYSLNDFKNIFILVDRDYWGTENNDVISGNAGDNKIFGDDGDDYLEAGLGDDILYGDDGDDKLYGGEGDDELYGGYGNNILDGGAGNDILDGGSIDSNTFVFGAGYGHDIISSTSNGRIVFLDLNSTSVIFKKENNDLRILSKYTNDSLLLENYYDDNNSIIKNEIFEFKDGVIWTKEELHQELLKGTPDNDIIIGHFDYENAIAGLAGNDIIVGNNKNDELYGGEADDELYGGDGDDKLYAGDGDDKLYGGQGDDELYGGGYGNNILDGGTGNDILEGGSIGSNTFIFGVGYGNDIITYTQNGTIFLEFNPLDVILKLENNDLLILSKYTNDSLVLKQYFNDDVNIIVKNEIFKFSDGTIWTKNEVRQELLKGTLDDDTIRGTYGQENVIRGLAGNDTIIGNNKNDELYGGDDHDELYGGDGHDQLYGSNGNDLLYGGLGDDVFGGGEGNDFLYGGGGNDSYIFDAGFGQDSLLNLKSSTGTNQIVFNNVNSEDIYFVRDKNNLRNLLIKVKHTTDVLTIKSFFSSDPYTYVKDINAVDVINFNLDNITLTFSDIINKVKIGTENHDVIYIKNEFDHYIDGISGDDSINLIDGKYKVNGGDGNDVIIVDQSPNSAISGDDGNDTIIVSTSDDSKIYGGVGNDSLSLGGHNGETYGGVGDDQLRILAGDNHVLYGGLGYDNYSIADGSKNTLIQDEDYLGNINLSLVPFYAVRAGDHISDFVYPLSGNIEYAVNDIQYYSFTKHTTRNVTIEYDASLGEVKFILDQDSSGYSNIYGAARTKYNSSDVLFYFKDIFTLQDFENIKKLDVSINNSENLKVNYSDNSGYQFITTTLTLADIFDQGVVKSVYGASDDIIYGVTAHDFDGDHIYAGAGNDQIYTGNGASSVYGEEGNDYIIANDIYSRDAIYGGSGNDVIYNYDPIAQDTSLSEYLEDYIYGDEGDDIINIKYQQAYVYGGDGNDNIVAHDVDVHMSGGQGSDIYVGGLGSDYYLYNIGDGFDTIEQTGGGYDIIHLSGIYLDNVEFYQENNDLVLIFNNDSESGIFIKDHYLGGINAISGIKIEDSDIVLSTSDIENIIKLRLYNGLYDHIIEGSASSETLYGTSQNDLIESFDGNDIIWAQVGNDHIAGGAGNDYLDGGAGNDSIYGGIGNDTLIGGAGIDTFDGGAGDDKYYYYLADGADVIDQTGGGTDVIWMMDQGITEDRIKFTKEINDLLITIDNNTNQSIRVKDHFLGGEKAISSVQPNGGYTITAAQIATKVNGSGSGTETPNSVGDTTYNYSSGTLTITEVSGTDKVVFVTGITMSQISSNLTKSNNDLLIKVNGSAANVITVKNFFLAGDYLVESFQTAAGEQITASQIFTAYGLTIPGTGSETSNPVGDTTYNYTSGALTITEHSGTDKVLFASGITFSQVGNNLTKSGNDLIIKVNGSATNKVTVKDFFLAGDKLVETFKLATGEEITAGQIFTAFGLTMPSTGSGAANAEGDTTYNYTSGDLTITEVSGNDKVVFASGITFSQIGNYLTMSGNDLILKVNGSTTNKITVKNFFLAGNNLVETFKFSTGEEITADDIFGAFGLTLPSTGGGTETGSAEVEGDTTYEYTTGALMINEVSGNDKVVFKNGITFSQIGNYLNMSGNDLILKLDGSNTNKVTVKDFFLGGDYVVETFAFETGGQITASQIFGAFGLTMPAASSFTSVDSFSLDNESNMSSDEVYQDFGTDSPFNAEDIVQSIITGDAGDNLFISDSAVSELFILNDGQDIIKLMQNALGVTAVDYVYDFKITEDQLDLSDFLDDSQVNSLNLDELLNVSYDETLKTNTIYVNDRVNGDSQELLILTNQTESIFVQDLLLNQSIVY